MEEKRLTEKESLELITQMIHSSKQNMEVGNGNQFLYWGYCTAGLSIALFVLITLTHSFIWTWGWMFLFGVWPLIAYKKRQKPAAVVTYTDKVINQVWRVLGWMFAFTFITSGVIEILLYRQADFIIMLPLSLLYCSLGVSITGIIIQERWMIYSPIVAFVFCIYMLTMLIHDESVTLLWYLYFGLSFVIMMIIPGHILNHKAKQACSKN